MAVVDKLAGRGAAIRNAINTASAVAAAAAAADRLRSQQAYNPNPVYVAPRAPIATAPATSYTVPKGTSIAPPSTRGTSPSRYVAPPPPVNITAQALAAKPRVQTPEPVPAAYKFFGGGQGYDNIENVRAQGQPPIVTPRPAVTPVGPTLTDLLQQQFQDYEAMRVQGGLPETRMGGFGPQYSPEPGVVYRPEYQVKPPRLNPPGTFEPLDIAPATGTGTQPDLPDEFIDPHGALRPTGGGAGAARPRPRGQAVPQRQQAPAAQQVDQQRANIRAQIMQIENQYRMGYQPGPTDADTLVQLYAQEQALARGENGPLDDLSNAGGAVWEAVRKSPVVDNPIGNAILDAAEELANTSVEVSRPAIGWFSSAMDWYSNEIQQPVKRSTAELLYNYALNDPERSTLEVNDFGSGLSFLFALPTMVLIEVDDALGDNSTRENIIAAYEAGGPDAAWEVVIGLADGAPMPVEMTWKITGELLTDPSTLLPWVSGGGRLVQGGGRGMRLASGATRAERAAGTVLERGGQAVDIAARGLDEAFILPFRGVRRAWQGAGRGTPSAFQMSPRVQQADAINALKRAELARNQGADELGSRPRPEPNQEPPPPNVDPEDSSLVDLQIENGIDETYVSFGDRTVTVRRGGAGYEIVDEAGNALASFTTRRAAVRAAGRVAKGIDTEFEDVVVRSADGTIDDADLIQRASPETGEVLGPLRAADIPDDLPMIRAAVARGANTSPGRSASRVLDDPTLITNTRGAFLDDLVARRGARAVAEGDMVTARQMEDMLRDAEGFASSTIGKEPNYQIWQEGGTSVSVPVRGNNGGFSLSPAEIDRLALTRGKPDKTFAGLLKQTYEHAYLLWNEATNIAPMFARRFGGENLPTDASQLFRVSGDTSFAKERFLYLAERYVKTADEDEARRIMDELLDTDPWAERPIEYVQEAFGAPYLTAIPPGIKPTEFAESTIRKEVHDVLRSARRSWQDARTIQREAQVADQIGGGLKGESKKAAKRIRDAAEEEAKQRARGHAQAMREQHAAVKRTDGEVVAQFQWKRNHSSSGVGTRVEVRQYPDGSYHVWGKLNNEEWADRGVIGQRLDPNDPSGGGKLMDIGQYDTLDDFIAGWLSKGDSQGPWATLLGEGETFNSPRIKSWANTPDAGPPSATNVQNLGPHVNQADETSSRIEWRLSSEGTEEAGFGPTGAGRLTADDLAKHPSGRRVMEAENPATGRKIKRHTWTSKKGERVEGYQLFEHGQYVSTAQAKRAADFLNERIVRNEADEAFSTESILNRTSKQPGPNDLGIVDPITRLSMRVSDRIQQYQDATITAAPDELFADIVDPEARYLLEHAAEGFRREDALLLDKPLPDWKPPRKPRPGDPEVWRVSDALAEIEDARLVKPDFDYEAAYDAIAFKAAGLNVPPPTKAARNKIVKKLDTAYDGYMNGIQRQHRRYGPLTGVRNIVGDTTGQIWQGVVSGRWEVLGAANPYRILRDLRPFRRMDRDARRFADSIDDATLRETGQIIPLDLMPSTTRGEDPFGGLPSANKRVADKSWVVRAGANMWTVPGFKDWLTLIDIETRLDSFRTLNRQFVKGDARKAFAKRLRQEAGDDLTANQWRQAIEAEARRKANGKWNGLYSPGDIEVALRGMTTKNTDLARAWQKQLNEASARAVKGTQDTWFTYKNTNLDEKARRIFVFHYWQSRAIPFHIRATLRNPVLLNGYYKMWQELEQMGEEGRYPWYLDRMFRFFQSPAGIEAYFDPLGILLPTTLFDAYNEQGSGAAVFINQMSPLIGAAISVAGWSDFSPNLGGIKNDENFLRKFMNYLIGQGHDPSELPVIGQFFDPNTMLFTIPTEELTNLLIGAANQALINAGLPAVQPFEPFNRGANELDQLRTWVQQVATEQYGPRYGLNGEELWTPEQMAEYEEALLGVQSGMEGNDILDLAMERYGNEDGLSAALSLIAPGGAVVNSRFRTDQMDLADRFADQGYTGTPEEHAASDFRQEAKATDPAWVIANQQWHNLGTPEQQAIWDTYWGIVSNPEMFLREQLWGHDAESGDQFAIDTRQLLNMTEDQRKAFADQWLAEWPGGEQAIADMQALRDEFKAANPEIADFRTYVSGVYDYEGGPGAFIDMMLGNDPSQPVNPNFKRAYDERREYLESQGKKGAVLEAELEDWATSQDAFFAAMGMQQSIYDDKPLPVYDPSANPYANPQFAGVMDMGPESAGGNQYSQSDDNKRDKATDSAFEQSIEWADENNRKQWATSLAEQMYGDAWNEQEGKWETWAYKDKNYRENVLGLPDGNTDYYMDESPPKPGESSNDNRFQEWVLWMQRTNPGIPASELTPMAWAAWETGTWEEYMASISPPAQQYDPLHALWARHLYN